MALSTVLVAGACVSIARADGDPASDYLVSRQVFVASQGVRQSPAQRQLLATVRAANSAGFAIRVAIISSDYDLGSITALWRKPAIYARFLSLELSSTYRGRLLIVMPSGFGFSWPAHSTARAYQMLAKLTTAPSETGLSGAAQTAVRRLAVADGVKLGSPSTPPTTRSARARAPSSVSVETIVAAAAALALLAAGWLVLGRRAPGRRRASVDRTVVTGRTRRPRLGVAVPGFAVVAVAVGAPILALRSHRHSAGASSTEGASMVTPPPYSWPTGRRPAPGFELRDQDGHPVSLAAYRGRAVIVTFIDPLCRNLCPLEAKVLNDAVGRLPARSRPEILAVSVDVYANARADLLQDVRKWDLVPQWHWAVGSPPQLAAVWKRYEIGVKVTRRRIAGNTIDSITHTEAAYVVDATGHERALFLWPFYPQDVVQTLRRLA